MEKEMIEKENLILTTQKEINEQYSITINVYGNCKIVPFNGGFFVIFVNIIDVEEEIFAENNKKNYIITVGNFYQEKQISPKQGFYYSPHNRQIYLIAPTSAQNMTILDEDTKLFQSTFRKVFPDFENVTKNVYLYNFPCHPINLTTDPQNQFLIFNTVFPLIPREEHLWKLSYKDWSVKKLSKKELIEHLFTIEKNNFEFNLIHKKQIVLTNDINYSMTT